jgi:CubicO group peptidase (beta-lactamase class C family)
MHDVMAGYVERDEIPGLVTLVSRRSETYVDTIGAQSVGGEPMRRDTIFRISSMTKPLTTVAVMILVEECTLRLDDPVDHLLPELATRRDRASVSADHGARPAYLPHGLRPVDGATGRISDPEGRERAADRHGAAKPRDDARAR